MKNRIFSTDSAKAVKAQVYGYLNAIHYLAPYDLAGVGDLCGNSTPECRSLCLGWQSGQAGMVRDLDRDINSVRQSRIDKARRFMGDRRAYLADVAAAIEAVQRQAARHGLTPCIRLNGSSDVAFEAIRCVRGNVEYKSLFHAFPDVQFVDYTKKASRALRADLPPNYSLTFSRSETNEADCLRVLAAGRNVAVVFRGPLPATWHGYTVINGDLHDLRHLDPRGVVVGLSPKGRRAKRGDWGFIVDTAPLALAA